MRRPGTRWMLVAVLATIAIGAPANASPSADSARPKVLETFLRMRILAAVVDNQADEGSYPGPTDGLVAVSSLDDDVLAGVRRCGGSARDAWGNALLYWSDGQDYFILSLGSDKAAQFDYNAVPPYANVSMGWTSSSGDDLMIVNGVAYRGPASQRELLRRAMSEMRSAGTATESFAVDKDVYPGPVEPIAVATRVAADLEPIYIKTLPTVDPWGNPYLFWSDTQHYGIVSYGPDGVPEYPYANWGLTEFTSLHTGPTVRFGQDLLFVDGAFVQWPSVSQRP